MNKQETSLIPSSIYKLPKPLQAKKVEKDAIRFILNKMRLRGGGWDIQGLKHDATALWSWLSRKWPSTGNHKIHFTEETKRIPNRAPKAKPLFPHISLWSAMKNSYLGMGMSLRCEETGRVDQRQWLQAYLHKHPNTCYVTTPASGPRPVLLQPFSTRVEDKRKRERPD